MGCSYRTMEEIERWMKKDPIPRFEKELQEWGILDEAGIEKVRADITKETDDAVDWAERSPFPLPDAVMDNIYVTKEEK